MRTLLVITLAAACVSGGCIAAARQVERAIRRSSADPEESRPAARKRVDPGNLPQVSTAAVAVKPGHPRLFVDQQWPAVTDDVDRAWRGILIQRADVFMKGELIAYSATKLLTRSREALKRISLLAGVYRFTGDAKYAEAGKKELLNVCNFPDWQPDNMLACSEMMTAASIGYDWLYDTLSPAERKKVVAAIGNFGLNTALDAYESQGGWTRAQHNWNLVCNGGTIVGALAIAEEDPALSKKVLALAFGSIRYGLSAYDKNGGTEEGPMYHSYATRYLTFAAAALKTAGAKGTDPFASVSPNHAWLKAAHYRLNMTGPSGLVANFGDGGEMLGNTAWVLWLAGQNGDATATKFQADVDREDPSIFDLLWYRPPATRTGRSTKLETHAVFASSIVLRSPDAKNFLALRTGGTADHHSHLDLGNFVLDLNGVRFAHDLGADNYGLPGYLGPRRADYLRSNTPGHNTLTIGETSQPLDVEAKATAENINGVPSASVDLTEAYPGVESVVRTASLDGRVAQIIDTIRTRKAATFIWHLHTPADVKTKAGGVILERNGKRYELKVIEPAGAKITVEPDVTRPPQQPVEGSNHVRVTFRVERDARVIVQFRPAD